MQIKAFRVDLGAAGFNTIEVDGEDITRKVAGLDITARPGQVTAVTLYLLPQVGEVVGEGAVTQMLPSPVNLASLDAESIQDEAMNRLGWEDGAEDKNLTQHIIDVIQERLDAQASQS